MKLKRISEIDEIERQLGERISLTSFRAIREWRYWVETDPIDDSPVSKLLFRIESKEHPGRQIEFEFTRVSDVRLVLDAGLNHTDGLRVADISDRGLEGVRVQLEDYEEECYQCYAEDVEVRLILSGKKSGGQT